MRLWVFLLVLFSIGLIMSCSGSPEIISGIGQKTVEEKDIQNDGEATEVTGGNRLIFEKSPYLLQHADNPVDWFPWGPEAFEKAESENKPIFLSIGYSTCHWCHVMEHESFEDPEVAQLMNETFVSIKVDREERPDIDMLYMTVAQLMTGGAGWPLTIIMTPAKEPFFAATYIPRETNSRQIGMLDFVSRVKAFWLNEQAKVQDSVTKINTALQQVLSDASGEELGESTLRAAFSEFASRFDNQYGGFGSSPKFPTPHNLLFLLRYWKRSGDEKALQMVEKTLEQMQLGGMYDHIGYGFHRYSTDSRWRVPHFEKMLYDQALLAQVYTEAYQATAKEEYAQVAEEIFVYVLRDMTAPDGGFYSAEDADSEGSEGKFYQWTQDEIGQVLDGEELTLAVEVFNIRSDEANILFMSRPIQDLASEMNMSVTDLKNKLDIIRQKLFRYREERVHPYKDDKVLTDWNGLMIAALAKGARVFDKPEYALAAGRAVNFITNNMMTSEGWLLHRYRDGDAAVLAYVDDYTFFIYGLLELYETTFDPTYLQQAITLNEDLLERFWADDGAFYFAADNAESLLVRQKEISDGAIPSGNSVAMLNMLRLGRITADPALETKAVTIGRVFSDTVNRMPSAHSQLLVAVDFIVGPSYEIVVVGRSGANDTNEILTQLSKRFIPNKVVIMRSSEDKNHPIDNIAPFIKHYEMMNDKATVFVCVNYACALPTTEIDTMLELLK
jgi:uncharacterized protein YyaL (SSP411 family)